MIASSIF